MAKEMKTPNFTAGGFMRPRDAMRLRSGELAVGERSFDLPDEFDHIAREKLRKLQK
jgi:hypothetical protein